jgi:hypothetical protein
MNAFSSLTGMIPWLRSDENLELRVEQAISVVIEHTSTATANPRAIRRQRGGWEDAVMVLLVVPGWGGDVPASHTQ